MIEVQWAKPTEEALSYRTPAAKVANPSAAVVRIIEEVAEKYRLNMKVMLGKQRNRYVARARQEAMYRAVHETGASYPQIGATFRKDHTTVMHAAKVHAARLAAQGEGK